MEVMEKMVGVVVEWVVEALLVPEVGHVLKFWVLSQPLVP